MCAIMYQKLYFMKHNSLMFPNFRVEDLGVRDIRSLNYLTARLVIEGNHVYCRKV